MSLGVARSGTVFPPQNLTSRQEAHEGVDMELARAVLSGKTLDRGSWSGVTGLPAGTTAPQTVGCRVGRADVLRKNHVTGMGIAAK
jgi:hypothetical protein